MKKKSSHLAYLRRALWNRAMDAKNPEQRKDLRHLHQAAMDAEEEVERMIEDMEMMSLRHPAFPDDFVGYPDEDMKLFDEIEEEKKKQQKKDNEDQP